MSGPEEPSCKRQRTSNQDPVPLVDLDISGSARTLVQALQQSGFLLVRSSSLSRKLQVKAIEACRILVSTMDGVEVHPSDPKRYRMLRFSDLEGPSRATAVTTEQAYATLREYWKALQSMKRAVLRLLAEGLELQPSFFANRHAADNDTLRLLHYPAAPDAGNRCKEHSDYGSLTLLNTDVLTGLELWDEQRSIWSPVPDLVPDDDRRGLLVVNAGSLLSTWTRGAVKATLHRVAGPRSSRSGTPQAKLIEAAACDRYSLAFFIDPDPEVCLREVAGNTDTPENVSSVADYVRWRCGLLGEGVSFAHGEKPEVTT